MSAPVILVGRRPDGGHRDRLWSYCQSFWTHELGWPICVGLYNDPGPFCLAHASNRAKALADEQHPGWEVALYVGADVVLGSADQARQAVAEAEETGWITYPHDHYYSLSQEGTDRILAGEAEPHGSLSEWPDKPPWTNSFSSALVITRDLWDRVGGFDERFRGWGFEDQAFFAACKALGGGVGRVTGPVFHLYHPRVHAHREGSLEHADNEPLGRRYLASQNDPEAMLGILTGPDGPLARDSQ